MIYNRFFLAFIIFISYATTTYAQSIGDLLFGKNTKTDYIGQRMDRRNLKNGMGVQRLKNGAIYVGDFSEGKMSGFGMIISPECAIANAPGATFYVGRFFDNKKERKGTLYGSAGDIMYQGQFVSDKPAETYPMQNPQLNRSFAMLQLADALFWGEVENEIPNGFGLMLQMDGSIWVGTFKDGQQSDMCITIYGENVWEVGQWKDGIYTAFNNSNIQANRRQEFVAARKQVLGDLFSNLLDVSAHLLESGIELSNAINGSGGGNGGVSDGNVATGKSLDYYMAQYRKWESRAKNCFENRVSKKLGAKTAMDHQVANGEARNLRGYQKLMRQVRMAAQKSGYHIPISTYEIESF